MIKSGLSAASELDDLRFRQDDGARPEAAPRPNLREPDERRPRATTRLLRRVPRRAFVLSVAFCLVLACLASGAWVYQHNFYSHVAAQEAAHAVEHRTFDLNLRGHAFTLHFYQQQNARDQAPVLFTSGDGGWSPFCADIAAHIAATGKTVVGFDAKTYLTTFGSSQEPITPEELAADYRTLLEVARRQTGVNTSAQVALAGWSLGAGYSVLAASDPEVRPEVSRVVAISLPQLNELAWKPTDALIYITHGVPHEKLFDAGDYLARGATTPLVTLIATDDDTSPLADARKLFARANCPKQLFTIEAHGHHFEQGEADFYRSLDISLA